MEDILYKIAIYGGTFDPVHKGHLATALTIQKIFRFDAFHFVPCKDPLLKPKASASAEQRVHMLQLALDMHPQFTVDCREIQRNTPSRMVDTLESFRLELPNTSITLIMGMDAFLSLQAWYEWGKLPELAHILVIQRPGVAPHFSLPLQQLLKKYQTDDRQQVSSNEAGSILFLDAGYFDISSTDVREYIQAGRDVTSLLDKQVLNYIQAEKLYI